MITKGPESSFVYEGLFPQGWSSAISRSRSYSRGTAGFTNPNNFVTGFTQVMSCYLFTVIRSASQLAVAFGGFAYGTDVGNIVAITQATIEYPSGSGNFFDLTFSGSQSVNIGNGQVLASDPVNVSVTAGTILNVRTYAQPSISTLNWPVFDDAYTGDKLTASTGTTPNGCHVAYASLTNDKSAGYGPCGIFGNSSNPTVALVGDSVTQGVGDTVNGPPAGVHAGWADRAFNNTMGLVNVCRHAEQGASWSTGLLKHRRGLAYSASRAIVEYGNNDVYVAGAAAEDVQDTLIPIWRDLRARGIKVWATTITPRTTSTDAWATTANQTPTANGAARIAVNQWLRDGAPIDPNSNPLPVGTPNVPRAGSINHPLTAIIDISGAVETAQDSGIWQAPAWTADGTHPTATGHIAIAALVPVASFL